MRARADTRRRGALRAQAMYSVSAPARVANVSSWLLLRVLRGAKVELIRSGRCVLVPVREIQTSCRCSGRASSSSTGCGAATGERIGRLGRLERPGRLGAKTGDFALRGEGHDAPRWRMRHRGASSDGGSTTTVHPRARSDDARAPYLDRLTPTFHPLVFGLDRLASGIQRLAPSLRGTRASVDPQGES